MCLDLIDIKLLKSMDISGLMELVKKDKKSLKNKANVLVALLAFIFSIWVIIGCGQEVVFYGFILLMIGIPFYIYINNSSDD